MSRKDDVRTVYSTAAGGNCAVCGWPAARLRVQQQHGQELTEDSRPAE